MNVVKHFVSRVACCSLWNPTRASRRRLNSARSAVSKASSPVQTSRHVSRGFILHAERIRDKITRNRSRRQKLIHPAHSANSIPWTRCQNLDTLKAGVYIPALELGAVMLGINIAVDLLPLDAWGTCLVLDLFLKAERPDFLGKHFPHKLGPILNLLVVIYRILISHDVWYTRMETLKRFCIGICILFSRHQVTSSDIG